MRKRILALLLAAAMTVTLLAGCGSSAQATTASETTATEAQSETTDQATTEASAETETESEEETKAAIEPLVPDADGNVTITDMLGRTVTYPANPNIWNSSPTAEGWLTAIVPDQIAGWARAFTEEQLTYLPSSVADIEEIGGNYGTNQANTEQVLAIAPEVIVNTFDCSSEEAIAASIEQADSISEQYDIPVIAISRNIEDTPEVAGLLGLWLGNPERGAEVQEYLQSIKDKIDESVAAVPDDERVTYYYAEGADGLQTESADSFHADVFKYVQLIPCVDDSVQLTNHMGMEQVSLEQVLMWDPEYIFVWNKTAYENIMADEAWQDITALKEGHTFMNPALPENWFDRSPSFYRILGCLFTAARCYPDYVTYDLDETVKEFFKFMYDVDLTDAQLEALWNGNGAPTAE